MQKKLRKISSAICVATIVLSELAIPIQLWNLQAPPQLQIPQQVANAFPGGFNTNITMWYKADEGYTYNSASSATWDDQSGNNYTMSAATPTGTASAPEFVDSAINFNPAVDFNGSDDALAYNFSAGQYSTGDFSAYIVMKAPPETAATGLWQYSDAGNNEQGVFVENFANTTGIYIDDAFIDGNMILDDNQTNIVSIVTDTANTESRFYKNGFQTGNTTTLPNALGDGCLGLGFDQDTVECGDGNNHYDGQIAEFVVYSQTTDEPTRKRIESYLALKYGITIDQSTVTTDDGTGDYVDSNGTVIFDAHNGITVNPYNQNIFGIGRDIASELDQQISKSEADDAILTISTDNDLSSANGTHTQLADGQFLILSSNGGTTTYENLELDTATYDNRIAREWRVSNTNNVSGISLKFDFLSSNQTRTTYLLSDVDGDFSTTGDQIEIGQLDENGEINGVNLVDNTHITVAMNNSFPGGVGEDLNTWLIANSDFNRTGTTEATWIDQSGNSRQFEATFNGIQNGAPLESPNSFNFNTTLEFGDGGGFDDTMTYLYTNNDFPTGDKTVFYSANTPNEQGNSTSTITPGTAMWQYSDSGQNTDGIFFRDNDSDNTDLFINNGSTIVAPFGYNDGRNYFSTYITNTSTPQTRLSRDGSAGFTTSTIANPSGDGCLTINMDQDSSECFDGNNQGFSNISEFIIYEDDLIPSELQRVETYLAIKGGITLDQSGANALDNTSDYIASNGTTIIFDAHDGTSTNPYNQDIFGIARDINGALDQQISKSTNNDAIITISTDTDLSSANGTHTPLTDQQFLMIANDGGTITYQTSELNTATYTERLNREWQATNTGSVSNISMKFDDLPSSVYRQFYLVTDVDGDFSTTGDQTEIGQLDENGEINNVTLSDQIYFTITVDRVFPGGVETGLNTWHAANVDYTYVNANEAIWLDQTINQFDLDAETSGAGGTDNAPEVSSNSMNFNTALNFSGTDDGLGREFTLAEFPAGDKTTFSVFNSNVIINNTVDPTIWSVSERTGAPVITSSRLAIEGGSTNSITTINDTDNIIASNIDDTTNKISTFEADTSDPETRIFINNNLIFNTPNTPSLTESLFCYGIGMDLIPVTTTGDCGDGGNHFDGLIGEHITYNGILSPLDKRQVESYLALKYGITLDQSTVASDDGTGDYNSSTGSVVFDAHDGTSVNSYNQNIIGIGRDDESGLNQQISSSTNTDTILTLSSDSDFTSENGSHTPLSDNQYLIIASDNGASSETAFETDLATYDGRISREWQASNTNNLNSVGLKFDGISTTAFKTYYLVTDVDGDFTTTGDQTQVGSIDSNGEISGVTLVDQIYFTLKFDSNLKGPGGVNTSVNMWYKANEGYTFSDATTSSWADQSGNGYDLSTGVVTNNDSTNVAPTLVSDSLNFNPTVNFDGIDDTIAYNFSNGQYPNVDFSTFVVMKSDDAPSSQAVWQYSDGGNNEQGIFLNNFSNTTDIYINNSRIDTGTVPDNNEPNILSVITESTNPITTERTRFYINSVEEITDNDIPSTNENGCFSVGFDQDISECRDGDNHYEGEIAELVVYSRTINETERARIESYLAIKYGITTDQSIVSTDDGTGDYIDSQNNKIFDAHDGTSINSFNNDIFVIGRDDESDLAQIISKSENSDSILTILAEGESSSDDNTIANQTFTDLDDLEFLAVSNNNGTSTWTDTDAPTNFQILDRQWQSNETGDLGTIQLDLNVANTNFDLPSLNSGTNYYIVVDTDNDNSFADETPQALSDQGGDIWRTTNLNLDDNIFTFATELPTPSGPAGIISNILTWYKANEGYNFTDATTSNWVDQSGNGHNLDTTTVTFNNATNTAPTLVDESINFNPSLQFDGADDALAHNFAAGEYTTGDFSSFIVLKAPDAPSSRGVWQYSDGGNNEHSLFLNNVSDFTDIYIDNTALNTFTKPDNNQPNIVSIITDSANPTPAERLSRYYINSNQNFSSTTLPNAAGDGCLGIGYDQQFSECRDNNFHYQGNIAEKIMYSRTITEPEKARIESYLAIKYGITIDQSQVATNGDDGTGNYVSSSGTIIYDAHNGTSVNDFNENIFGIGHDLTSNHTQIKSKSENPTGVLTILAEGESSSDNNVQTNVSLTDLSDQEFLMISNDGESNTWTNSGSPSGFQILNRKWISNETGEVGTIQLDFDTDNTNFNIPAPISGNNFYLVLDTDNDGNLDDETPQVLSDEGSNIWRANSIDLDDTLFTLATEAISIEFATSTGSDTETSGGNLPSLIIDGNLTSDTNIDIEIQSSSTATLGSDFSLASLTSPLPKTFTVVIPSGNYSQTTLGLNSLNLSGGGTPSFTINNDNNIEANETIVLQLTNPQGSLSIGDPNGDSTTQSGFTYTITDNETTTISIEATDSIAQENSANTGTYTVSLDGSFTNTTGANITVNYTVDVASTASSPGDYAALSGSVNIPNNSDSATITLDTSANDSLIEGNETVIINLSSISASGGSTLNIASAPNNTATITIQDDEVSDPAITTINRQTPTTESTNATSVTYRVTFTEAVVNVDTTDFELSTTGTASGSINSISAVSTSIYDVTINSITGDGTINLDVAATNNIQSPTAVSFNGTVTTEQTYTIDNTTPTVTVNQAPSQPDPTSIDSATFRVVFSEAINPTTFTNTDITLSGTSGTVTSGPTQVAPNDGTTFEFTVTGMTSVSTVTAGINSNQISDLVGNLNTASTSTDNQVTYNTVIPTISSIVRKTPTSQLTNSNSVTFTATFTQPVTNVSIEDFDINTTGTTSASIDSISQTSSTVYDITINSITGDGTLDINIDSTNNNIQSTSGVAFNGTITSEESYIIDNTQPSVTVNQAPSQSDPTSTNSATFRAIFSEPINTSTFTSSDITLSGTVIGSITSGPSQVAPNDGTTFEFTVTGMISGETVSANLAAGVASDLAGNTNTISTSTDNSISYSTSQPSITSISRLTPTSAITNSNSVIFQVIFSEAVTDVTNNDFDLTRTGTVSSGTPIVSTLSSTTYNVTISSITGDGTLNLDIDPANDIESLSDVALGTIISSEQEYIIDNTSPDNSVTLNSPSTTNDINADIIGSCGVDSANGSVNVTTDPINGFSNNYNTPISLDNSGNFTISNPNWSAGTYDLFFSCTDQSGNGPTASTGQGPVTINTTAPSVTVNNASGQSNPTNNNNLNFTAVFSQEINLSTFSIADISTTGSTASGITINSITQIAPNDGTTFNISVTSTNDGDITISIPANRVENTLGTLNLASTSTTNTVTLDRVAPTPLVPTSPLTGLIYMDTPITGSCGLGSANGTATITTTPANGFTSNYNTAINLDANGNYNILNPNWTDNTYDLNVSCSDQAGNSADISVNNFTIDDLAPTAPTISNTPNSLISGLTTDIFGSCETGSTVNITSVDIVGSPITTSCSSPGTYSSPVTFNTLSTNPLISVNQTDPANNTSATSTVTLLIDEDNDGISSLDETNGPNGGDSNGDSIQDINQPNVASTQNEVLGNPTSVEVSNTCSDISSINFENENIQPVQDPNFNYPFGITRLNLNCGLANESADIKIIFDQEYDTSLWRFRGFSPTSNIYSDISDIISLSTQNIGGINKTIAELTVLDGDSRLDQDEATNSTITILLGPGIENNSTISTNINTSNGSSSSSSDFRSPFVTNQTQENNSSNNEEICLNIEFRKKTENIGKGINESLYTDLSRDLNEYEDIIFLLEQEIISGLDNTNLIAPNEFINRAEVSKILTIARDDTVEICKDRSSFIDVLETDWFYDVVTNIKDKDIVHGYPDLEFKPGRSMSYAEAYKVLAIGFGLITRSEAQEISITSNQEWYEPYRQTLIEQTNIPIGFLEASVEKNVTRRELFEALAQLIREKHLE